VGVTGPFRRRFVVHHFDPVTALAERATQAQSPYAKSPRYIIRFGGLGNEERPNHFDQSPPQDRILTGVEMDATDHTRLGDSAGVEEVAPLFKMRHARTPQPA